MSQAQQAIKNGDAAALGRYMRLMEACMSDKDVKTSMPFLLVTAGCLNKRDCFEAILPRIQNFDSPVCRSVFSQLIENKHDSLRNLFINYLEVYAPDDIYERYSKDLLLEYGAKAGRVDVIDEAFKNGARLVTDEYGQNKPLCAAVKAMQLEATERLLKENVPLKNSIITISSAFENGGHKNILPMIELLLGYGLDIKDTQSHSINRFMVQSHDMTEETGGKIDQLLDAWQQRKKYIKFPVRLKDNIAIKDLTLPVAPTETHYEKPLSCMFQKTTALHRLAAADRFEEVIRVSEKTGEPLTYENLTCRDPNGNSVIDILGARNTLNLLEKCHLAKGQEGLFLSLVNDLPPIYRRQLDTGRIKHALTAQTLDRVPRRNVVLRRRTL
ncbi:MAG: hypothetical protein ACQEQL_07110 [Pseudomonadota bacterium]